MRPLRGMTLQLLRTIIQAGICSIALFVFITQISNMLIGKYFTGSELQQKMTLRRVEKLSAYIADEKLAATDCTELQSWCDKQPLVLMEVYRNNYLLFNSNYYEASALGDRNIEITYYDWYSYYEVSFSDGPAELLVYSDESYLLQTTSILLGLLLAGVLFYGIVLHGIKKTIQYIYLLTDEISIMGNGDLNHPISIRGNNELTFLARGLETTRRSLLAHRRNEEIMLKANNDMITGLSHDLRTPLTKIMLCVEILQGHKYRSEQEMNDFLTKTYHNSLQLKAISEHILQYSVSQRDLQSIQSRTLGFQEAFYDIISEMADYFAGMALQVDAETEWPTLKVEIIDLNVRRVMDNIVSNIEKYADRSFPIAITTVVEDDYAGFEFKNRKLEINALEGHHVGLDNLQSLLAQMGGRCLISEDDSFTIKVLFHIVHDTPALRSIL